MLFGSSGVVINVVCVKWGGYRCCLCQMGWLWMLCGSGGVVIEAVWVKWGGYRCCLGQVGWL